MYLLVCLHGLLTSNVPKYSKSYEGTENIIIIVINKTSTKNICNKKRRLFTHSVYQD